MRREMHPVHIVEIETPKGVLLNGMWIGAARPKRVVIWVHGLGSSMFSKMEIGKLLARDSTAVLMFNNRGHDNVASVTTSKGRRILAGAAHERFTDSADDIEGAINFVRRQKAKAIFLAGHSTGCQKSIYWASKKGRGVRGIVLLAPISDVSAETFLKGRARVARALKEARALVRAGKRSRLLPSWDYMFDAQRLLTLVSGKGPEEIFTYWSGQKSPRTLKSVRIPILVLLAEKDEFADRPAKEIAVWFKKHVRKGGVTIVPRVGHSFKGGEKAVVVAIRAFIR